MQLLEVAKTVFDLLDKEKIPYALIGGLAVGVHGHIRATQDIDIIIQHSDDYKKLTEALGDNGWIENQQEIPLPDGAILHRWLINIEDRLFVLDILLDPQADNIIAEREQLELDGAPCWVINKRMLIRMKRQSGRDQDLADVEALGS